MEMQFEFCALYLSYTLDKFSFFLKMCAHSGSQLYILSIFLCVSTLPALSDLQSIHLADRSELATFWVLCIGSLVLTGV